MSVGGLPEATSDELASDSESSSLSSANEELSERLTRTLNQIRAEAIFALKWWRDQDPARAAPLEPVGAILSANNLQVGDGLGDAGFRSDPENFEILFNADTLRRIEEVVIEIFGDDEAFVDSIEEIQRQAASLYLFHEVTHINQRFVEHSLAASMKSAFTPDELSKIDLVADVRAAHCNALIATAIDENADTGPYLEAYRNNLMLSYQLLVRAFSIKNADHKRKRALGLLTCVVLCQSALQAEPAEVSRRVELAVRPAFTSVDGSEGCIVALTCGSMGWEILFHGSVATNRMTIGEMWDSVGTTDPSDILALLRVGYEKLM